MRRIMLILAYDGTDFYGYQVQNDDRTVQKVLEDGIFKLTGERVKSVASGRTDSGVHAEGQVVHFDTNSTIPGSKFKDALNSLLDKDLRVLKSKEVNPEFHARYSAKIKVYKYSIYNGEIENPLFSRYATFYPYKVDFDKINEAIKEIVGTHDFKCFLASGSQVKNTVRTIEYIKVAKKGKLITFTIKGNGFLYNMVRIIVGTLLDVSQGRLTANDIKNAIETKNRRLVGKTMPPNGLRLYKVYY